jgi:hypothetical protein
LLILVICNNYSLTRFRHLCKYVCEVPSAGPLEATLRRCLFLSTAISYDGYGVPQRLRTTGSVLPKNQDVGRGRNAGMVNVEEEILHRVDEDS